MSQLASLPPPTATPTTKAGPDQIAGFAHDIGAVLVKATTVTGEAELAAAPEAWSLQPEQFPYPWQTDDPK